MSDQYNANNLQQNLQNVSINNEGAKGQNTSQGGQSQKQGYQAYNPQAAPSFTPQQQFQQYQQGGYQGYQDQYQNYQNQYQGHQGQNSRGGSTFNSRGGYQAYNPQAQAYNPQAQAYNPNQAYNPQAQAYNPNQTQGMSLADFEKQKKANLNTLNKPKKNITLVSSSGIKIANAKKVEPKVEKTEEKKEEKKEEPKEEKKEVVEEKKEVKEITPAAEVKAVETPVEESTPAAESKPESKPVAEIKAEASTKQTTKSSKASTPQPEDEIDEEVVKDLFGGKDHISLMFMGHVDAGKSTMGGNILYLTGSVDKRTVDKYEKEAKDAGRQGWYLSWIMDTNKEERSDGKTIEVGKAYFETEKRRYTILDAPGHKMYVSEMIGGASQADIGVLVISARKGEYETGFEKGGQTREHALLAKNQGVGKIIIVINKMDDPTVSWSEARYKECIKKPKAFLSQIGYKSEDVIAMPVSGYTGAGLKNRVDPKECPWYTGPALLEYLDKMDHLNRSNNGPFMLPIAGKMKDMGTIVEGKIESGHIKKNQSLLLMPIKATVEVSAIYNETEQEADAAYCGEQVRLKLKGVEEEDLTPGFVLTSIKNPVNTVSRFAAQIAIVELKSIMSNGFTCVMHLHTAIEEVKLVELKHKLEMGTNKKSRKPPAFAKKGMKVIAIFEVPEPICAETFKTYPQLGRFTLRDQGTTIAIGKITKLL